MSFRVNSMGEAEKVVRGIAGGERAMKLRKFAKDEVTAKRVLMGAAGGLAIGGYKRRTGRAANKMGNGRPTGMYGY